MAYSISNFMIVNSKYLIFIFYRKTNKFPAVLWKVDFIHVLHTIIYSCDPRENTGI